MCVALWCAAPAWAEENSITIYGVIDQVVEVDSGTNMGNGTSGHDYRLGLGSVPSRLGFRGSEDLGGGFKALFVLEGGINPDTGTAGQGGRIFGRQSWVGLGGEYGTASFGRQYTMRYYAMLDADFFGAGSQGLGSLDSGIPNARADNAFSHRGTFGRVTAGANYSLGRDAVSGNNAAATNCAGEAAGAATQCREWSVMAKYDSGNWGVASAYERQHGGTSGTYGGLTSPTLTDTRFTLNGFLKLERTRLGLGWLARDNEGSAATPKSNLYWLVGEQHLSDPVNLTAMYAQIAFKDSPNRADLVAARANYWFSKRTTIYISDAYIINHGTLALAASSNSPGAGPLPGESQNSLQLGLGHTF
jgi:predicted porin